MKLNKRQNLILDYINSKNSSNRLEIEEYISSVYSEISKVTILSNLNLP